MARNIKNWPVMARKCNTCPFHERNESEREIANMVRARSFQVSQICHHPRTYGKKETHLCRGGRDHQITIFYRLGFLPEPTDQAWVQRERDLF
jgi:hypothetical protein